MKWGRWRACLVSVLVLLHPATGHSAEPQEGLASGLRATIRTVDVVSRGDTKQLRFRLDLVDAYGQAVRSQRWMPDGFAFAVDDKPVDVSRWSVR